MIKSIMSKSNVKTVPGLFLVVSLLTFIHAQEHKTASEKTGNFGQAPQDITIHNKSTPNIHQTKPIDKAALKNIDALQILFPADSSSFVNGVYPLDAEGCIHPPAIEAVCITGKSLAEIAAQLESAYSNYVRFPFVRLKVLMRIGLLGGFHRPGLYYVHPETPFWDVIALGGGPKREDGFKKMKWQRQSEIIKKDLTLEIVSGKTINELDFASGDVITLINRPKLGVWAAFRSEIIPFLLMISSLTTSYMLFHTTVIDP